MQLIPYQEMTDEQWAEAHALAGDKEIHQVTGATAEIDIPPLVNYYDIVMKQLEAETLIMWAILTDKGEFVGSVQLLLANHGEWEIGCALREGARNRGYGPRAAVTLLNAAFAAGIPQVVAFTYGKDERVRDMLKKLGFRRITNFWYLDLPTWVARTEENKGGPEQ